MNDENAILEINENMILKLLAFKHEEEFNKESKEFTMKRRNKSKDRSKEEDKSKDNADKKEGEEESKDKPNEELKEESNEEPKEESLTIKKPESSDATTLKKPALAKSKISKGSEKSLLKKSDISFGPFRNCSGVGLTHFIEQLKFLEAKAKNAFLKACTNL